MRFYHIGDLKKDSWTNSYMSQGLEMAQVQSIGLYNYSESEEA